MRKKTRIPQAAGIILAAVLAVALTACGGDKGSEAEAKEAGGKMSSFEIGSLEDGFYMAQEEGFSEKTGWKYVVTLQVADGKIAEAVWNGAHQTAGPSKVAQSKSGDYGMVEKAGAQAPWYEQAAKAEAYLLEKQDPTAITYTDDVGHTDAISGVSIHVVEFFDLAQKALEKGPVGRGPYKDGSYHAEMSEFDHGWKAAVDLTVLGGRIVAAEWDALAEESDTTKKEASRNGEYGMMDNSGAQAPWFEQAEKAEAYLIEVQDPTQVPINDQGATDAISGVSIGVEEFFTLADKALEQQ